MKHAYRTSVMISIAIALIALVGYLLLFARSVAAPQPGHDSSQGQDSSRNSSEPADLADTNQIMIQNYTFTPMNIRVKKNKTVIWTNADTSPHRVKVVTGGQEVASNAINYNGSFSLVFDKPGTFTYYDSDAPDQRGTVLVTDD